MRRLRCNQILDYVPVLPALIFLGVFFVYPIAALLTQSFWLPSGQFSLSNYERLFHNDLYVRVLLITMRTAAWTTLIAVLAGYPVAYVLATVSKRTRHSLLIWILMPLWTSFLVRTFAWMILLGRHGVINDLLLTLGIVDIPPRLIYNFTGVLVSMTHALIPMCIVTMLPVMETIDQNLMKAAGTLGARASVSFLRIYFPLSLPGVTASALLVFITALGFFIMPALLGGANDTMIVQTIIFQVNQMLNWGFAGAISSLFLLATIATFLIYDRLVGLSALSGGGARDQTRSGARFSRLLGNGLLRFVSQLCALAASGVERLWPVERRRTQSKRRWALTIFAAAVVIFLCAPALFVIPVSFTKDSFLNWPPTGFSTKWYEAVIFSHEWLLAAYNSFVIAILAATGGMIIGVPVAFFMARRSAFGKSIIMVLILSPMIIPHIITAISLFFLFSQLGMIGTIAGMVIAHTTVTIPFVVLTVMALLKKYDIRLDQAASTLGAGKWATLVKVTFPIIKPGMIAAFMFAFISSFDELTIALFVTGGRFSTLPKMMWDGAVLKVSPTLAAVASMLLLTMTSIILISRRFQRTRERDR